MSLASRRRVLTGRVLTVRCRSDSVEDRSVLAPGVAPFPAGEYRRAVFSKLLTPAAPTGSLSSVTPTFFTNSNRKTSFMSTATDSFALAAC